MKFSHDIKCPYCGYKSHYNIFEHENKIYSIHVIPCYNCHKRYAITLETNSRVTGVWTMELVDK